jgi:hypothetical protein
MYRNVERGSVYVDEFVVGCVICGNDAGDWIKVLVTP